MIYIKYDEKKIKRFPRVKDFISSIQRERYFYNGEALDSWKIFDTRDDAYKAVKSVGTNKLDFFRKNVWCAVEDSFRRYGYYNSSKDWKHDLNYIIEVVREVIKYFVTPDALITNSFLMKEDTDKAVEDAIANASLMALVYACDDLFPERRYSVIPAYFKYAKERWDVYVRGYGLYREVGGTFYVYRKPDGSLDE